MTNKAYIVVNEQQERIILEKLERDGFTWFGGDKPTENMPSNWFKITIFPYVIFVGKNTVTWNLLSKLEDEKIVFDGRKEEQMSDKYVVSQEFMNELEEWKVEYHLDQNAFVTLPYLDKLPIKIDDWRYSGNVKERNNRLIAILHWVNGEDVFEVEKPKKWVVRSKDSDLAGDYWYVYAYNTLASTRFDEDQATHFNTKEEAESWANSHQEIVEVEE